MQTVHLHIPYIWQTSMGTHWAEFLLFIVVVAQTFCLIASRRLGSRMLFAFSRDGAVPGHRLWRASRAHRVPSGRAGRSRRLGFALVLPTYWNSLAGYYVGTSVGMTGLYIAFILPVILRFRPATSSSTAPGASASTTSGST